MPPGKRCQQHMTCRRKAERPLPERRQKQRSGKLSSSRRAIQSLSASEKRNWHLSQFGSEAGGAQRKSHCNALGDLVPSPVSSCYLWCHPPQASAHGVLCLVQEPVHPEEHSVCMSQCHFAADALQDQSHRALLWAIGCRSPQTSGYPISLCTARSPHSILALQAARLYP